MAYVSEYGNWGTEEVLVFDITNLNEEQREVLYELPDYDKLPYIKAVLNGDDTSPWE